MQRGEFGERETNLREPGFHATLEHAGGVKHSEEARPFGLRHLVQICSISQCCTCTTVRGGGCSGWAPHGAQFSSPVVRKPPRRSPNLARSVRLSAPTDPDRPSKRAHAFSIRTPRFRSKKPRAGRRCTTPTG